MDRKDSIDYSFSRFCVPCGYPNIGCGCAAPGNLWIGQAVDMRLVIQRVKRASVSVDGACISEIGRGLLVLAGVSREDTPSDARFLAKKTVNLRIFDDAEGRMNLSAAAMGGDVLAVSQFTLYGDCTRGNRPSYIEAARPEQGEALFNEYVLALEKLGPTVKTGRFGADMKVDLLNDGPVTILLESSGRNKD